MAYDPGIHHRRSIRLHGYDYSLPGLYFVTVCSHQKEHLLGQVVEGEMKASEYGEIVAVFWNDLPTHYPHVRLDSFVVMPNHVHGTIEIVGGGFETAPTSHGLPEIVRGLKHIRRVVSTKCTARLAEPYGSATFTNTSFGIA